MTSEAIVRGGWQLAGGHGDVDADEAVRDMRAFVDAGLNRLDLAQFPSGRSAPGSW